MPDVESSTQGEAQAIFLDGVECDAKWKTAYHKLEKELLGVQEKLKKKQECLLQVQGEKESQYVDLK